MVRGLSMLNMALACHVGLMKHSCDEVGPSKVTAFVTDSASAMKKGRELLVQMDGYKHIIPLGCVCNPTHHTSLPPSLPPSLCQFMQFRCCARMRGQCSANALLHPSVRACRCAMHNFNLVMGSCVAHPWAKSVATNCQKIVTYFRASTKATAALARTASSMGEPQRTLLSANKTRFTSTLSSVQSVLSMERPLRTLARREAGSITKEEVMKLLRDDEFWGDLQLLCRVLQPFELALTAIQSREARLADISRHFVYLAQALQRILPDLPAGKCHGPVAIGH